MSDEVPVLFIPSTRIDLWGHDIFEELTDWAISHPKLLSEGFSYEDLNELRDQYFKARPTSDLLWDIFAPEKKIFYGNSVALAISRIWAEIVSAGSERTLFQGAIEIGYSCARAFAPRYCAAILHILISNHISMTIRAKLGISVSMPWVS